MGIAAILVLAACGEVAVVGEEAVPLTTFGFGPAISGDRVVWKGADSASRSYHIIVGDLRTGRDTSLGPFEENVMLAGGHAIAGSRVAWVERRRHSGPQAFGGGGRLVVADLETGERVTFPVEEPTRTFPSLSEEAVAWVHIRGERTDVVAYELATGLLHRVTEDRAIQTGAGMDAGRVTWIDHGFRDQGGTPQVYLYDLHTLRVERVGPGGRAALSGDRLAWLDAEGLRMRDLSTGVELELPDEARIRVLPAIDGDRMVWMERSPGRRDIWLGHLTTGERWRLNRSVAGSGGPSISGNRVVWRDEGGAVLLYEIPAPEDAR